MEPDGIKKQQLIDDLKQEFESSIHEKVFRYLEAEPHKITSASHFAPVSAECTLIYRDGYFYGCIALCQAVAEALVRFMCQKNSWRPSDNYKENVENLSTRRFISESLKKVFIEIWQNRCDYHHLNPTILQDRQALATLAKEKIRNLVNIETEVFGYTISPEGMLIPTNPQYWETNQSGYAQVFLKIRS